jgi:hypothetical protein
MFAAVQGGKTTFGELSAALFNVAPAAAAAGVSMEEINAGIATLTSSGVPTSVATTQLRAALTGLQRPSKDLDKIFKKLGFESAQVAIESKGLGFALDAVKKASGGNNGELQKLLGSVEAVSAANIIAGTGAGKFADELDRQAKSAGSTEKAFDTMQKTTAQQFQKVMVSLQNIAIRLGDALLPAVNAVLGAIESLLTWFNNLSEGTQTFIAIIAGIAAAIGPVLIVIGKLLTFLPALKVAFVALTGPIGLTIAAVAALGAAVYLIYDNWGSIKDWFSNLWSSIKITFLQFVDAHLAIASKLFGWIPGAEDMIGGLRTEIGTMIDGAKVEAEAKKVEQAAANAANEASNLKDGGEDATAALLAMGAEAPSAVDDVTSSLQDAVTQTSTLQSQINGILEQFSADVAQGERELAFLLRLDGKTALLNEIEATKTALSALANDTTISIDDQRVLDLQANLQLTQTKMNELNDAEYFASGLQMAFQNLNQEVGGLSGTKLKEVEDKLKNIRDFAKTPEDFTALAKLEIAIQDSTDLAIANEEALLGALDLADDDTRTFMAMDNLYLIFQNIDGKLTGQNAIQAKIDAVWQAVADGEVTVEQATELTSGLYDEWNKLNTASNAFGNRITEFAKTQFPNLYSAIDSAKTAVTSFRSAFKGDNEQTPMQNINDGLGAMLNAIRYAKSAMAEFGTVAGLALTGLQYLAPETALAISTTLQIMQELGVDVKGALDAAAKGLTNLLNLAGGGGGSLSNLHIIFNKIGYAINDTLSAITDFNFSPEILKNTFAAIKAEGGDFEDYIQELADKAGISFAEMLGAFTQEDILKMKLLGWAGLYDPETGDKANVSPELQAQIMARLAELQASDVDLSPEEIMDVLKSEFGSTALKTLGIAQMLGLPPLAKGGIVSGAMMALIGDNPHASSDPEIVSPLSKLKSMLVDPTLDAVSNMMGYGNGTTQVIYVNLDGRVLSQSVFENLPDVVRINNGSTF